MTTFAFDGWTIALIALAYVSILFVLAWLGDRTHRVRRGGDGRPMIYALSLAVYCTSWTFFGSVGLAAATGYDFIPVYLGPILVFLFGLPLLLRIVRLTKTQNITSVSDFLASRYGKSQTVAAIVTIVLVLGVLPYIALQLKAVALSVEALIGPVHFERFSLSADTAFVIAMVLAVFAILFGTRHIDATEHQNGLMVAIAAESIVKLMAFLIVGAFVVYTVFGGVGPAVTRIASDPELSPIFGAWPAMGTWVTTALLSSCAIVLLPRQFHVMVVENTSERELERARWLFPLYLVLINLFVVPIAAAGLATLPQGLFQPDTFVLALPLAANAGAITILAFVGGLSAATAMVIVDSIALAIMISNTLVVPWMVRRRAASGNPAQLDIAGQLLLIRRVAIVALILLGYFVYRLLGQTRGLASIGLVSFAAVAQLAPAFLGGLFWRQATARGAIAGVLAGFAVWIYTLMLPWLVQAGLLDPSFLRGPFGIGWLAPQALFGLPLDSLTNGVLWSLLANSAAYWAVSRARPPEPVERLQAHVFVEGAPQSPPSTPAYRLWRTSVTAGDLQRTVARYLGPERATAAFETYARNRSVTIESTAEADIHLLRQSEHLLASAVGAPSARLVLSLLLRRGSLAGASALRLLDDASEALQYNRDLLQSALDQVRHGLSVFDKDLRLICWNRQFGELLDLPSSLVEIGAPLERILRYCAERGDFGPGDIDGLVAERLLRFLDTSGEMEETVAADRRILEIRTSRMPQGGVVTTYSDITDRVAAAEALARANETLERRVFERTQELIGVNAALERARAKADAANQDKTRFLAAASHDVLQPLNAARLYVTSFVERQESGGRDVKLARNIDASLEAVEEIFNALIDIARLDTGSIAPDLAAIRLDEVLTQLRVEFEPLAAERGLSLRYVPTSAIVHTDRRHLRRILQNLISNAIKYTATGGVVVGVRRAGENVCVVVADTGPGIEPEHREVIFKEFHRLDATATRVQGLGLGLSIVDRIARMLGAPISLRSRVGHGSAFSVRLPRARVVTAEPVAPPVTIAPARMSGLSVLCIDNEATVLDGMRTLLEGWQCRVDTAAGPGRALELFAADGRIPDILLVDYHLDRTTGIEAIDQLRAAWGREVPAIVITADNSLELHRAVRASGYGLLRKPLKAAALRAAIGQFTAVRSAAE